MEVLGQLGLGLMFRALPLSLLVFPNPPAWVLFLSPEQEMI